MSFFDRSRYYFFAGLFVLVVALVIGCGHKKDDDNAATSDEGDIARVELTGRDSTTVLQLLMADHEVQYKQSSLGTFVTGIDTLEVTRETYWIYSVNDSTPSVGADRYVTQDGDRVVWHYRQAGW